jgi:FlaA1/EpsC-like NDP-sugar epimerase
MAADSDARSAPNLRIAAVACHDLVMAALSFELAVFARYYALGAPQPFGFLWEGTAIFTLVCGAVFWWFGIPRGIWRYAALNDFLKIARAAALSALIFLPVLFVLTRLEDYPRSALIINIPLLFVLVAGSRLLYRLVKDGSLVAVFVREDDSRVPVLLVGASDAAETFIREMARPAAGYRVVGILAEQAVRVGRELRGVRVLGGIHQCEEVIARLAAQGRRPQRLIIATDAIEGVRVRALLDVAERAGMTLSRLPKLTDFRSGPGSGRVEGRPVAVEDLLGRAQKVLDRDAMRALIAGRRVLVTGAGGTIGGELVRQCAAFGPAHLTLFDAGEYNLYRIDRELDERHPELSRVALLGDVRDRGRVERVFARERPDLVFHAAAFKHVPLSEANPNETVLTNVLGTYRVAQACRDSSASTMVLISTDKAVRPASVMGATKRLAETVCQALALDESGRAAPTRFVTVRFGNVLGSTGSVVPLFQDQIAAGGPITVTHAEATRYFMTAREAVELVLQASADSREGDEAGKIYVLDMGDPVRIQDLARQMIRLAGTEIAIAYTGLRPGEKLTEALFEESESPVPTSRDGILLAVSPRVSHEALAPELERLFAAAQARRTEETLAILHRLVPAYGTVSGAGNAAATATE